MNWNFSVINPFIACVLLSLFVGCLIDMGLRRLLQDENAPITAHIGMAVTAVFLCLYGFTPHALRCILLCQVLIVAGAFDAATYEIPDCLHFLIMMAGLIGFQPVPALLGAALVPLPFLIVACRKSGSIGGGDVKLMAASGFALGVTGGVWMMVWGLLMGVLWNRTFRREKKSLPLAPFLAFGCFMTLFPT